MNKYLIVVFCVLTGCAVVIPYSECEGKSVNAQLLEDWYSINGYAQEESYAIHYIVRHNLSFNETHFQTVTGEERELIKDRPILPEFMSENPVRWPSVNFIGSPILPDYSALPLSKSFGRTLNIRAPDTL